MINHCLSWPPWSNVVRIRPSFNPALSCVARWRRSPSCLQNTRATACPRICGCIEINPNEATKMVAFLMGYFPSDQMGARVWASYVFSYFGRFTRTRNDLWFNSNNRSGDGDAWAPRQNKTNYPLAALKRQKRNVGIFLLFWFFASPRRRVSFFSSTPFYPSFVFDSTFTWCVRDALKHKLSTSQPTDRKKDRHNVVIIIIKPFFSDCASQGVYNWTNQHNNKNKAAIFRPNPHSGAYSTVEEFVCLCVLCCLSFV